MKRILRFYPANEDGQYEVFLDLCAVLSTRQLDEFKSNLEKMKEEDKDSNEIYKLDGSILKYTSETLMPAKGDDKRKKLLFVLGNPATHSITGKMFFFSKNNGDRHSFWGKLEKADILANFNSTREDEANSRRKLILDGNRGSNFIVSFTTFYSFPTPVEGKFKDVAGVEKLFKPIIYKIMEEEFDRINQYAFSMGATLICTQKAGFDYMSSPLRKNRAFDNILYWPIRGKDSSGDNIEELLNKDRG